MPPFLAALLISFNPRTREGCDCAFAKPVEQGL